MYYYTVINWETFLWEMNQWEMKQDVRIITHDAYIITKMLTMKLWSVIKVLLHNVLLHCNKAITTQCIITLL